MRKVTVTKRSNDIVNRLNKTKREAFPDLAEEREAYEKEVCGCACPGSQAGSRRVATPGWRTVRVLSLAHCVCMQ